MLLITQNKTSPERKDRNFENGFNQNLCFMQLNAIKEELNDKLLMS